MCISFFCVYVLKIMVRNMYTKIDGAVVVFFFLVLCLFFCKQHSLKGWGCQELGGEG